METLLAQTVTDWQLIVCDSYSDDGSWEFFQELESDSRVRLYQVPREGLYAGWNECLKRARGQYVYMATADDTCEPNLLEELLKPLESRPELALSVCDYQEIDEDGRATETAPHKSRLLFPDAFGRTCLRNGKAEFLLHASLGLTWVTMTSVLFRRDLLERTGLFNTNAGVVADQEWAMRASLFSDIAWTPKKLATWRRHAGQATPNRHWTWREHRTLLQAIERVLEGPSLGVPEEWQSNAKWKDRITESRRLQMREAYGAYRWVVKEAPRQFGRGVAAALANEPGWALGRARKGFPAGPELDLDFGKLASGLLEDFGVELLA